jgi:hypothetical protein
MKRKKVVRMMTKQNPESMYLDESSYQFEAEYDPYLAEEDVYDLPAHYNQFFWGSPFSPFFFVFPFPWGPFGPRRRRRRW